MGMTEMSKTEAEFHETAQRNALGTYIGCTGAACEQRIAEIKSDNVGHKIQGV